MFSISQNKNRFSGKIRIDHFPFAAVNRAKELPILLRFCQLVACDAARQVLVVITRKLAAEKLPFWQGVRSAGVFPEEAGKLVSAPEQRQA